MLRLITIPISHYCEKARWALDRAGLAYREERHVQGVHRLATRRAGGGATAPVLVTPDGAIGESHAILAWADGHVAPRERLLPTDAGARAEAEELCRGFDAVLGPAGRRLVYVHMLGRRELALPYNNCGVPAWEDRLSRPAWPLIEALVSRALGIRAGVEAADEATVFAELDRVAALLDDGRSYLCDERFGAADLTFAALAAPVLCPPGYGVPLPQPDVLPPAMAALVLRAREHPAGRHALGMFERHRRERAG